MGELVRCRDNYLGHEQMVTREWLERWPEDYTVLEGAEDNPVPDGAELPVEDPPGDDEPLDGADEKEQV